MEMHQWVTGIRVAKSGKQLFTNYRAIEEEITHADIDILTSKRFSVNSPPNSLAINQSGELNIMTKNSTGCKSQFRKIFEFKNWKEPMLVLKQTIPQQKALDLSFNLAPWKWAWHYHEGATPSCPKITLFTQNAPLLFAASRRDTLLILPPPL